MTHPVHIRLCPRLSVERDGRSLSGQSLGSRKARTLLGLLAVDRRRLLSTDEIADVLWGDEPPADPPANVATLVSRLRGVVGEGVIGGQRGAYGLVDGGGWTIDLEQAAQLVREAATRRRQHQPALVVTASLKALDLLGPAGLLLDETEPSWAEAATSEADGIRRQARHLLVDSLVRTGTGAEAIRHARDAVTVDPYDETAHRDLMRALTADGQPTAALEVYTSLADRLREDLGTDPDDATVQMHLALLRGTALDDPARAGGQPSPRSGQLVGRDRELTVVTEHWDRAVAGGAELVVVQGEAGIGKSRLLDEAGSLAEQTGGVVLTARCHEAERALFLQPFVELLRPVLLGRSPAEVRHLVGHDTDSWVTLIPELRDVLTTGRPIRRSAESERRRAYDAVTRLLSSLSRDEPILVVLDDLQEAGAATVDLVAYLRRHLGKARVLTIVAVRTEGRARMQPLVDAGTWVVLGPLPGSAVTALVSNAGLAAHAASVYERTAGHALSVVEMVRALTAGESAIPESLAKAILARVERTDPEVRETVESAAVLGVSVEPVLLAALLDLDEVRTVRRCQDLVRNRLLNAVEHRYEFVNDLVQETIYAALPVPVRRALHRRAADLLGDRPEAMARHAIAADDPERAARGWLLAGENAMRRGAVEDARQLYDRAADAADAATALDVLGRVCLARAGTFEASTDYEAAVVDIENALQIARQIGDRRLEMAAYRELGGDTAIAFHRPRELWVQDLTDGLEIAVGVGDRAAEADLTSRLALIEASRLRLTDARQRAESNVSRMRGLHDSDALLYALDGLKSVHWYLGDAVGLDKVISEMDPLLRARSDTWFRHWVVFESSFALAARGEWIEARQRVDHAVELTKRAGYPAFSGFFVAHRGWLARLAGDLDVATEDGAAALDQTSPLEHPWWYATAAGFLASTLLEQGRRDEAADVAARGLSNAEGAAYRLRCLAPLAAATLDEWVIAEAVELLRGIDAPAGSAWIPGADSYLSTARACIETGAERLGRELLVPLVGATDNSTWRTIRHQAISLGR